VRRSVERGAIRRYIVDPNFYNIAALFGSLSFTVNLLDFGRNQ